MTGRRIAPGGREFRLGLLGMALWMTVSAGVAEAQSLGEIARREEARRKTVTTPGKVYTNESLRVVTSAPSPLPLPPSLAAGAAPAPVPSDSADQDASAAGAAAETPEPEGERDEAYWRKRMEQTREALRRSRMFAEALQSRINGLTADFAARDDPAQRDLIAEDRQRAIDELDRLNEEIAQHTKALADAEEEARRAGVPPGWLR